MIAEKTGGQTSKAMTVTLDAKIAKTSGATTADLKNVANLIATLGARTIGLTVAKTLGQTTDKSIGKTTANMTPGQTPARIIAKRVVQRVVKRTEGMTGVR
mmetsp:Transcript_27591/g.49760  ORF Transcript_27591/g.49760 Transcript_27591/m.49760 type:complete len:101 (-) Transcript_27591:2344-2646(-)